MIYTFVRLGQIFGKEQDKSYVVLRRALLEHSLLVGLRGKGVSVQVLAFNRNSSEQKKLLDERQEPTLVIVSAL